MQLPSPPYVPHTPPISSSMTVLPSVSETKFHTHKIHSQITVLYYFQLYIVKILSNQTTNESVPNGSKHALNVICLTCLLTPIFGHN
jgi:hypothetical protein